MRKFNFSNYEIDVENGTIFSYLTNKFIGNKHPKGYIYTTLTGDDGLQYAVKFHRFIWECINGEIPDGYDVHHIDKNKMNNSINNLELKEKGEHNHLHKSGINHPFYGMKHSSETKEKMSKSHIGKRLIPIVQLTMQGDYVATFNSVKEAGERTGINCSNISTVINNKAIHAGHYKWVKLEEHAD
jgi:hypothetical protein